jgi:hypothetical protein
VIEHGFGNTAVPGLIPVSVPFNEVPGIHSLGRLAADECRKEVQETDMTFFGEFHLTTSQFGSNFYIGNGKAATGSYEALKEGRGRAGLKKRLSTRSGCCR